MGRLSDESCTTGRQVKVHMDRTCTQVEGQAPPCQPSPPAAQEGDLGGQTHVMDPSAFSAFPSCGTGRRLAQPHSETMC